MLAPKGCGLLYLRREFQKRVHPVFLHGGFAAYTGATGTRNVPQILAQGVALEFHELIGRDRVEARVLALAESLRQRLQELPQVRLASPTPPHLCSAMTTIQLLNGSAQAVQQRLQRGGLVVKHVPGDQLQEALRISTHLYNTEAELDRLVVALRDALA
jgi:selenocysteine lyase/cysteine desulfurase